MDACGDGAGGRHVAVEFCVTFQEQCRRAGHGLSDPLADDGRVNRLANGGMPIAVVAPIVGYESESAFGAVFKRVLGTSPRQFAKAAAT